MSYSPGLRFKLGIVFITTTIIILGLNNFLIYWNTSLEMEEQLGSSLEAVASVTAAQVDRTLLLHLLEKNVQSRTVRNMRIRLQELAESTGMNRIYLFNSKLENLVDSADEFFIGAVIPKLRFERDEMDKVLNGLPASSILFRGQNDMLFKSGYAPVILNNTVVAAVGVDASATFLLVLQELRRKIFLLGLACIAGAVIAVLIFSQTLVKPLSTLVTSVRQIGSGNLNRTIPVSSSDEIGFLGKTIEEMRANILRRDQQLKMMIASIAHEIRNPLGGIELFAELVQNSFPPDNEGYERIQKILEQTGKLKSTLNGFLEYAKPSLPEPKRCRLKNIIDQVRPFVAKDLEQNKVSLNYEETGRPGEVICDERHFAQILLNLFQNAIGAMPDGGSISVSEKMEGDSLVFCIADEGLGISDELREKIFDPFVTSKEKGTGLGLAVVKKLVEENGGEIALLNSQPGGTTFQITLPAPKTQTT